MLKSTRWKYILVSRYIEFDVNVREDLSGVGLRNLEISFGRRTSWNSSQELSNAGKPSCTPHFPTFLDDILIR